MLSFMVSKRLSKHNAISQKVKSKKVTFIKRIKAHYIMSNAKRTCSLGNAEKFDGPKLFKLCKCFYKELSDCETCDMFPLLSVFTIQLND